MLTLAPAGLVALAVIAAFGILFRRLLSPSSHNLEAWRVERFSTAAYRPLRRLMSEADYKFLQSQAGYEPAMERSLRRRRGKIARAYIRSLSKDFQSLHKAARLMLVLAPSDQPALASALMRQRLLFWRGMGIVQGQLLWNSLGIAPIQVDFTPLLAPANWMQVQLQSMAQQPAEAAAA